MEFVLQRTWIFSVLQIYNTSTGAVGPFCGRFKQNTSVVSKWNYLKCSILGGVGSHVVVYYNTSFIVERREETRTEVSRTWTMWFSHILALCEMPALCPYMSSMRIPSSTFDPTVQFSPCRSRSFNPGVRYESMVYVYWYSVNILRRLLRRIWYVSATLSTAPVNHCGPLWQPVTGRKRIMMP